MPVSRVRDVMTVNVITADESASVTEIAAILTRHRIGAVPIVDRYGAVVGVVSWTDLHRTIETSQPDGGWLRHRPPRLLWPSLAVTDVMSAPPVTIGPELSLSRAGRLMRTPELGRLVVLDRTGRMVGIVTRGDLLKVYDRLDAVIRDEVQQDVMRRTPAHDSSIESGPRRQVIASADTSADQQHLSTHAAQATTSVAIR